MSGNGNTIVLVLLVVVSLVLITFLSLVGQFLSLYIQAMLSGARVGLLDLMGMRLRKVDVRLVVLCRIRAFKAGIDIPTAALESHCLAGGHVAGVVDALVRGRGLGIPLEWQRLLALDLAGHDVMALVEQCAHEGGHRPSGVGLP